MNWQYYNPLTRLRLFSNVWSMSARVRDKLEKENPGRSISRIRLFSDYLCGWLSHGFSIVQYEDYEIYRVKRAVRKNIVTNRRALELERLLNADDYRKYLEDKTLFNKKFEDFVKRRWLRTDSMSKESLGKMTKDIDRIIIKPIDGERGIGISILPLNHGETELDDLFDCLRKTSSIIEEVVKQHPDMAFGRRSVNTIRMYTLMDKNGCVHLLKSVMRIGAPDSDVDNYHCGGSIWPLDRENGFVECAGKTLAVTTPIFNLPPSQEFMLGYHVPHYREAVDAVKSAARLIPQVRYIGWDVAITPEGVEIIEANSSPDNDFHCLGNEHDYYGKLMSLIK